MTGAWLTAPITPELTAGLPASAAWMCGRSLTSIGGPVSPSLRAWTSPLVSIDEMIASNPSSRPARPTRTGRIWSGSPATMAGMPAIALSVWWRSPHVAVDVRRCAARPQLGLVDHASGLARVAGVGEQARGEREQRDKSGRPPERTTGLRQDPVLIRQPSRACLHPSKREYPTRSRSRA